MACRPLTMIGLVRLICEPDCNRTDSAERKVFDVPKTEALNLKRRLEQAGWTVTEELL